MKKYKIIGAICLFILSFAWHFGYDILPNFFTSILFPVNESIWEHMKIFWGVILFYGVIEYFLLKRKNINVNNYLLKLVIMAILSIFIFLIIYLPIYNIFGENFVITIILMFITYAVIEYISYLLFKLKERKISTILPIFLIFGVYLLFGYLTYNPLKNYIFYDISSGNYGIEKRN